MTAPPPCDPDCPFAAHPKEVIPEFSVLSASFIDTSPKGQLWIPQSGPLSAPEVFGLPPPHGDPTMSDAEPNSHPYSAWATKHREHAGALNRSSPFQFPLGVAQKLIGEGFLF